MSKPRRVYLLETEHFDFLFSELSGTTAKLLADNGERLYDMAREAVISDSQEQDFVHDLRIPVVISPDSDRLSVDYTSSPYNRIVIFDGVPESAENNFQNTLLGLFYHEVFLALSQSVRDPVNQFIYKTVGGDSYQPISLVYLPFSFVEGRAFLEEGRELMEGDESLESECGPGKASVRGEGESLEGERELGKESVTLEGVPLEGERELGKASITLEGSSLEGEQSPSSPNSVYPYGHFRDKEFLEILSIAKYEGKFPNWIQAGSARDIYPGRLLNEAAGTAFSAYLMHTYGVKKYVQFWNECGKVNLNLTSGMFKKVYGRFLSDLWKDFEASVPLPDNLDKIKELETKTKSIFKGDTEGLASNLIISDYGLVWYDDIRHEVDILDLNNTVLMKRLLFLASNVKKLTLSPDGRYLVVSFYGISSRIEFRNDKVWLYDLQKREFLDFDFTLRDGVFVKIASEEDENKYENAIAGIDVKDKVPNIYVYDFHNKKNYAYKKSFAENEYPCDLTFAGNGKVSYIVSKNDRETFHIYDFENDIEKGWTILYKGMPVNIKKLRRLQAEKTELKTYKNTNLYTFEYFLPDAPSFVRMGVIVLDSEFEPVEVYFQDCDVAGGVRYPAILNNHILFCSNKFSHNEIQYLSGKELPFIKGSLEEFEVKNQNNNRTEKIYDKKLGNYDISFFNPLKYMMHVSFVPFMALKELSDSREQKLWPSLGGTVITQYDPFMNSRIMFSGSGGYAKLDFSTIINPTTDDVNEKKKKDVDDNKNISFGVSVENTSTPVDIRAGCLFKFNTKGEYNFCVNGNTFFRIPLRMAFSKFDFGIHGIYTASTDYYDRNLVDYFPSLSNWPKFKNAYETGKLSLSVEYSNIHQYGISKYEERGFSLGFKFDSFWDITEIKFLNDKIDKLEEELAKGDNSMLTKAQIKKLRADEMLQLSQLILGVFGEIKIPRLTPFNIINGFVLGMPACIKAEIFNNPGTAINANAEVLLLGYECQNGLPFLYLYFSRLGLKFGYNLNLNYDTLKVPLPDIRVKDNLWDIFSNTYVHDSIYFIYNMDFCAAIGRLSEYHLNLSMKTEYFLRSKGFAFSLNFLVSF